MQYIIIDIGLRDTYKLVTKEEVENASYLDVDIVIRCLCANYNALTSILYPQSK